MGPAPGEAARYRLSAQEPNEGDANSYRRKATQTQGIRRHLLKKGQYLPQSMREHRKKQSFNHEH